MRKNVKILATVALAVAGVAYIAKQSVGDVEYYMRVEKLMENPSAWIGKQNLQVHGYVVAGSIHEEIRDQRTHRTFQLESKGKVLDCRHAGVKPDTFKDGAETVVKGRLLQEDGKLVLAALDGEPGIMAKCPSKYSGK